MNEIIKEDLRAICGGGPDWEKFKNSTVLISGAYGLLASYMVFTLAYLNEMRPELNIKIIAFCRDRNKARKRFGYLLDSKFFSMVDNDLTGKIKVRGKVDYIIHAASPASPQFYGTDPVGVISPNVFGTKHLLELAREKGSKGFLFFSSGDVCGAITKDSITEKDYGYLDPTDARNCYAESKRMGENMCICWHHQYKVPAKIVRPEHTYGPTMDLENDKRVFSEFVSDVVSGRNIVMKSDGKSVRTFCYISDATDGFFRVLLDGKSGESYNVSNNKGRISIGDLASMIISLFPEKKLKVIHEERDKGGYLENKDKIRPTLSSEKLERLGFSCKVDLKRGFYRTIKSFEGVA